MALAKPIKRVNKYIGRLPYMFAIGTKTNGPMALVPMAMVV